MTLIQLRYAIEVALDADGCDDVSWDEGYNEAVRRVHRVFNRLKIPYVTPSPISRPDSI